MGKGKIINKKIIIGTHKPCVYFVKSHYSSFIKIGKTINLKDRVNSISKNCPNGVILLGFICTSLYSQIELNLHQKFKDYRCNGEWFDVPFSDIVAYINSDMKNLINNTVWNQIQNDTLFGRIDKSNYLISKTDIKDYWELITKSYNNIYEVYTHTEHSIIKL
jgi:hypothetical protein